MQEETTALLGQMVGHLRVVDVLAEGGMGAIYVGFDDRLQRKVAIKAIIREYRLDPEFKARFLREARILSQLDHPNICKVHNYLETEDNDCLVLELIEGRNLRVAMKEGLDQHRKMTIAGSLLDVLVAVHGQGVIHRDLKPENVMITPEGEVKVLDFGLSRSEKDGPSTTTAPAHSVDQLSPETGQAPATWSSESGHSVYIKTRFGTVLGTAGYMSPEQARGEQATAASDMYALGLVLQELFTGRAPYALNLPPGEMYEKVVEGQTLPVEGLPADLTELINRLKSIAPGTRPSSVDAQAQFQRILDQPKRRRKRRLVTAVWLILVLLAGGMTLQWFRASHEAKRAEAEAKSVRQVSEFLEGLFQDLDPEEVGGTTIAVHEILDRGARKIELELEGQPELKARLKEKLAEFYLKLEFPEPAEMLLKQALEIREMLLGPDHLELVATMVLLARTEVNLYRYPEAERFFERALTIQRNELGPDHPDVANTLEENAYLYSRQRRKAMAEDLIERAAAIREKAFGSEHPKYAESLLSLASSRDHAGRTSEAESLYLKSLAILERANGPVDITLVDCLNQLGLLYRDQQRYPKAEAHLTRALAIQEKILGPDHFSLHYTLDFLAFVHEDQGQLSQAVAMKTRAREIIEKWHGPDSHAACHQLVQLSMTYRMQGRYSEAEALLQEAIARREAALGPGHPDVFNYLRYLTPLYREQGRFAEEEALFREALERSQKTLGPEHPVTLNCMRSLARFFHRQDRHAEAEPLLRQILAAREIICGPQHPDILRSLDELTDLLLRLDRLPEAVPLLERSITLQEKAGTVEYPDRVDLLGKLTDVYLELDRPAEAKSICRRTITIWEPLARQQPINCDSVNALSWAYIQLGKAHQRLGESTEATEAWNRAVEYIQPIGESTDVDNYLDTYAQALLLLGRTGEARPVVERLLEKGWQDPEFLNLCREHDLL